MRPAVFSVALLISVDIQFSMDTLIIRIPTSNTVHGYAFVMGLGI